MRRLLAVAFVAAFGCASNERAPAPPVHLADAAAVPGFSGIRSWADPLDAAFVIALRAAAQREIDERAARGDAGPLPPASYLAISGGGANGAYGAGLLCGWTEAGTRPEFKVVTGISTGALTAPFAFLGSAHDATLQEFYTTLSTKDILEPRSVISGLLGDALADVGPLKRLLSRVIDDRIVQDIAAEHHRGRVLLVGTTNLDAQRGVVWDLTAIAASGHPQSLALIRRVLLASASIPAAFPPVMIDVDVDGRHYQEMHVDGGALAQVFFYPPTLHLMTDPGSPQRDRAVYVVRNARVAPSSSQVERKTLAIATRAIDSMILTQGIGDLYRIYATTKRDGVAFNLTYIPDAFADTPREAFDRDYMTRLFAVGREAALGSNAWIKQPPGFAAP